jgi:hypothetical protein
MKINANIYLLNMGSMKNSTAVQKAMDSLTFVYVLELTLFVLFSIM